MNVTIVDYNSGNISSVINSFKEVAKNKVNLNVTSDLNEIKSIICKVGEGTVHRLWEPLSEKRNPTTPYSAKFSVPFCVAAGIIYGKAGLAQFTEQQINDQEILNLCSKISYEIDPLNEYPKNYSGEIEITLNNLEMIRETQSSLRGGKLFPLNQGR